MSYTLFLYYLNEYTKDLKIYFQNVSKVFLDFFIFNSKLNLIPIFLMLELMKNNFEETKMLYQASFHLHTSFLPDNKGMEIYMYLI